MGKVAGGVVAGLGVGALALAGLSVLAPADASLDAVVPLAADPADVPASVLAPLGTDAAPAVTGAADQAQEPPVAGTATSAPAHDTGPEPVDQPAEPPAVPPSKPSLTPAPAGTTRPDPPDTLQEPSPWLPDLDPSEPSQYAAAGPRLPALGSQTEMALMAAIPPATDLAPLPALPSKDGLPGITGHGPWLAGPSTDSAPFMVGLPTPPKAGMLDPSQPVAPLTTGPAKALSPADAEPEPLTVLSPPAAPASEEVVLAQATEPAEPPTPVEPGRVQLEGGALPGRGAVPVRRPEAEPSVVTTEEPAPVPAAPPLRFAAPFTGPAEPRPFLSIVLLDEGAAPADPARLAALSFPVSVALDPLAPDAAERMAGYRAAGFEVLALAQLPALAQPQDVEVFLAPALATLPEAVAVLDLGAGGLRGRDETARMALSLLSRNGLGAVLVEGGFGGGAQAAEEAGVPAAEILRDLDGAGQDATAIRRQLDDAARRAGQDGEAAVLARLRPDSLEALAAWAADRRAEEVTLAPVSALLAGPS